MKQKSTQLQPSRKMASKLAIKVEVISKVIHQLLIEMKNNLDSSGFIFLSKQIMEKCSLRLLIISTLLIAGILMGSSAFAQRNITVGTTTSGGSWSGNTFVASADDATVAASEIVSRLNGGNTVTINTSGSGSQHGNIHVTSTITKTSGGTATLSLLADYRINIQAGISSSSGQLNFEATAGRIETDRGRIGQFRIWDTGSISTNGGNVTIEGVNNSVTGGTHIWSGRSWGCSGNPDCRGVQLNGSINAGGGHMSIVALRHSGGWTQGVRIEAATVQTTGNGNVYISGQGNGGSHGTVLNDNQVVRAQNGSITIIGDAATTGNGIGLYSGSIVETTGMGNVILTSTKGNISGASTTLKAGGTTTITAGTSSIDLSNSSNDLTGIVSVSSGANVTLANGKVMTLGPISVSGMIDIYTTTGNLTLNGIVSTGNTTVNAIRLNAGRNTSQPTITGGNIIRSSGNVTTGSGGTAVLYTGSLAGSTGITGLSGYNSSNVYYCTDRNTTLSPTPGSGLYVAYRECAPSNPTGITATHTSICNGGSTQLTAAGAVGTIYWYTGSCGGTQIGTGNPITVSPSGTTTYYARNYNNGLWSAGCASISINVSAQPTAPGLTRNPDVDNVCAGQTLTVSTTSGSGGTGTISDEFRYSTNNGANWSSWSTSVPSFAAVSGTNLIQSRRTADGTGCNTSDSNEVSWEVREELAVTDPSGRIVNTCDFVDQNSMKADFDTWVAAATTSVTNSIVGAASPTVTDNRADFDIILCQGGVFTVTWEVNDDCGTVSASAEYEVNKPVALSFTNPVGIIANTCAFDNATSDATQAQTDLNAAIAAWVTEQTGIVSNSFEGGCSPIVENNFVDTDDDFKISLCEGGIITVTWTITDLCETEIRTAAYTLIKPVELSFTDPVGIITNTCAFDNETSNAAQAQTDLNAAIADWVTEQIGIISNSFAGGCSQVVENNFDDTDDYFKISLCEGGIITVTWTITDLCETLGRTATFQLIKPQAMTIGTVEHISYDACGTIVNNQKELEQAFDNWLADQTASINPQNGCSPVVTNNWTEGNYPDYFTETKKVITVEWYIHDLCETKTVSATFTFLPGNILAVSNIGTDGEDIKYYCTIQDAVDGANAGDVILISAGTYTETVTTKAGYNLTLRLVTEIEKPEAGSKSTETIDYILDGLNLHPGDVLEMKINNLTEFDKLIVNGQLDLNNAALVVNSYQPDPGNTFEIISYGTLIGEFINKSFVATSDDKSFIIHYSTGDYKNNDNIVLTNVSRMLRLKIETQLR